MAEEPLPKSAGVQDLISRIRDEGVESGKQEASRLASDAQLQATRMLEDARAEVEAMRQKARAEIETEKNAALEALKLAARDTGLRLESDVVSAFESCVKRLVSPALRDPELIQALVLVLAGHTVEKFVKDREIQVLVSDVLFKQAGESQELDERARQAVLGITGDMLREGIELIPSSEVEGGARVRLVGENLEVDLTQETVHKVLMKHLLPRFRAILEGAE
jgi:V/A-type H+-transporting ATPase subunit E